MNPASSPFRNCLLALLVSIASAWAPSITVAETKDRIPPEQMERMVVEPLALAHRSRLDSAERVFDEQFRQVVTKHGPDSKEAADLLSAMGVSLVSAGNQTNRPELNEAAVPYLQRAVAVGRKAWGPRHPEVAVLLNDYAFAHHDWQHESRDTVLPALQEALAIRRAALGPLNRETIATARYVDEILHPVVPPSEIADPPALDGTLKLRDDRLQPDNTLARFAGLWTVLMMLGLIVLGIWLLGRQAGRKSVKKRSPPLGGDESPLRY